MTTITLSSEIESLLAEQARRQGTTLEELALNTLREKFASSDLADTDTSAPKELPFNPRNEWERWLLSIAQPCGGLVTDEALRRENLYDDRS